jgi:uncharacterized protein
VSQENVDVVRRVLEGWAQGDFSVGADLLAPDFEWRQFPEAVEPGTRRGAEVGQSLRRMFEVYENVTVEAEEFIDAGDRVVVLGRRRVTAKGSGLKLDMEVGMVWTLQDGKLVRNELFTSRAEALAAAGLND